MTEEPWIPDDEPEPRAVCPDCKQGKHNACVGSAWDLYLDVPAVCSCWERGHEE